MARKVTQKSGAATASAGAALRSEHAMPPPASSASQSEPISSKVTQSLLLYRLLKLTNLITRPFFTHFSGRHHITMNEMRVLMTLAPMGEAASHELCAATGMHPMNVSRSVAELRRHGRISERRDPANLRRKLLTLTPEGRTLYRAMMPHVVRTSEILFDSMSPLELEFLSKLINLLTTRLETVPAEDLVADTQNDLPPAQMQKKKKKRQGARA